MPRTPPAGWFPRRGEIYLARLDKPRPVLVLSVNALNRRAVDVAVVPLTSVRHAEFQLRVRLAPGEGGLRVESWAKCDQVTTLEKALLQFPPLGAISRRSLGAIEEAVRTALGLLE